MKNFNCELEMVKILFGQNSMNEIEKLLNIRTTAICPGDYNESIDSLFDVQKFSDAKTNCICIAENGGIKHTIMVDSKKALFIKK